MGAVFNLYIIRELARMFPKLRNVTLGDGPECSRASRRRAQAGGAPVGKESET